jgi:isopentenyl diphosphate isomerase/L-lactate dehydrogenase-like FMN-dependent dehydrogenase
MSASEVPFGNYQYEIYLRGLGDERPALPISYPELERAAAQRLTPEAYGYVAGGAGAERTVAANAQAFDAWRIVPRMLADVSSRDLRVEVLGTELPAPVMLAPIGVLSIVHEEGERAVARAAGELGVGMVLSNAASTSIEDVAAVNGDGPRWFQLYWPTDRDLTASFVQRAERAGYKAIVVTLDTRLLAWRPRDLAGAYLPFLRGEGIAVYLSDPVFRDALDKPPEEDMQAAILHWVSMFPNPTLGWDDLAYLRDHTSLPVLVKGVLHPDDVRRALDAGADGIVVSNHGGRQVDGSVGALDMLPGAVEAAGEAPVLFDSGVRTGADAFKALCLGARAVLLGRPYVWGLGLGGADGVQAVVRGVLADLDLTMALSGLTAIDQLTPDALAPAPTRG